MFRQFVTAYGSFEPFHLNEVDFAIDLDNAIDLFDHAVAFPAL
jgi:hypothetical protein